MASILCRVGQGLGEVAGSNRPVQPHANPWFAIEAFWIWIDEASSLFGIQGNFLYRIENLRKGMLHQQPACRRVCILNIADGLEDDGFIANQGGMGGHAVGKHLVFGEQYDRAALRLLAALSHFQWQVVTGEDWFRAPMLSREIGLYLSVHGRDYPEATSAKHLSTDG